MKPNSKRGVALAYVIVITAALLILAAALVSAAKFNLDSSQNSLESRQAYLDAKSAIEYARAYLSLNPDKSGENFSVLRTSGGAGFKIAAGDATNAVATYSSTSKAIKAAAKYKSSDRVRRLGYQFDTEQGGSGSAFSNNFLATGTQYATPSGVQLLFHDNGELMGSSSEFPVVATRPVILLGSNPTFTAPEINFIASKDEMGVSDCLYSNNWNNSNTLISDFIGFDGDIVGNASFQQDNQHNLVLNTAPVLKLRAKSQSRQNVIVRFSHKVSILFVNNGNSQSIIPPAVFEPGYYSIPNNTNLFDLANIKSRAHKLTDQELKDVKDQFLIDEFTNNDLQELVSSEKIGWTKEGKMEDANLQAVTTSNATVFMCATQFIYQSNVAAVCQAPNIVFQWNTGSNLAVSVNGMNASITFKAKNISINLKNAYGSPKLVASSPLSHFYLSSLTGATPNITFMTDTVIQTPTFTKTIEAGVYQIDHIDKIKNAYMVDLFDKGADLVRVGDVDDGGSGGSGDGTLTGGVYTNG